MRRAADHPDRDAGLSMSPNGDVSRLDWFTTHLGS